MKVLQVLPELNSGGVERGTLEVAEFLVKSGHESLVVSNGGRLVARLEAEGSRHLTLPVHKKSLLSLRHVPALRQVFLTESPDIVHVRSRLPAWLAWLAWRRMNPASRPRLVSTMHGLFSVNPYSRIMTCGERIIAISQTSRNYILDNYPKTDPARIRVIPRGIDPARFPHGHRPPAGWLAEWTAEHPALAGKFVILLPGRLSFKKGQTDLIRIVARLKRAGVPAHGLIAGDTHPRKRKYLHTLHDLVRSERVESDVTFLGHRSDVRELMAVADVVVSLTHQPEAFGRVSLEALCLGKPVAAYADGGVKEQLDYFFPPGAVEPNNSEACAALLESWFRNGAPTPPRKEDHPFTLRKMLTSTLAVYEELLGASASTPPCSE
jgi:glycosyltransferase involved in cell wall biosynthesis